MNLDELRAVQSKERQKDSLQNLRESFYQEVADFIAERETERERLAADAEDPFSEPAVTRLTDEIETAKDVVEAIYERRMGKLVKQASLAAAGMPADDEGLTTEERDLFEDLVERIGTNKRRVLDVLGNRRLADFDGSTESPSTASADRGDARAGDEDRAPGTGPSVTAADAMGATTGTDREAETTAGGTATGSGPIEPDSDSVAQAVDPVDGHTGESGDASSSGDGPGGATLDPDRTTVRITRDVGSFLGVDEREYELAVDDVVTLPAENAAPLVERGAAEPLE